MEDGVIHTELEKDVHLFAVLDGHGGHEVAQYAARHLPKEIMNEPYFKLRNYQRALINLFERIDHLIESKRGEEDMREIGKEGKSRAKGEKREKERIG